MLTHDIVTQSRVWLSWEPSRRLSALVHRETEVDSPGGDAHATLNQMSRSHRAGHPGAEVQSGSRQETPPPVPANGWMSSGSLRGDRGRRERIFR